MQIKKFTTFVATCGKIGYTKKAPGTAASFSAVLLGLICGYNPVALSVMAFVTFMVGLYVSDIYSKEHKKDDPSEVVIDEVAAVLMVMAFTRSLAGDTICAMQTLHLTNHYVFLFIHQYEIIFYTIIALFLTGLFRLFDIIKPWPISYIDKKIKGGLGIMMDDIAAGLAAVLLFMAFIMSVILVQ
jgi:phosphatidylglycerophosphatase A